ALRADALRVRGGPARLEHPALARRLGCQAAARTLERPLMSALSARKGAKGAKESATTWSILDRIGLVACWAAGILLCLVCGAIVLFMLVKGIQFVKPGDIFARTLGGQDQRMSGGFFDPLIGTLLLTAIGVAIALPIGIGIAVWLVEYGRPAGLARLVESGVEV